VSLSYMRSLFSRGFHVYVDVAIR